MDALLKYFDLYTVRARLLPAFLALIPLIALLATFLNINEYILSNSIVASITVLTLIPLLGNVARSQGLKVQKKVLEEWEVFPTTRLLRYSDMTYSDAKTERLHKKLSEKSKLILPTKSEEMANPEQADEIYDDVVSWLREKTRDSKFSILLNENIAYGMYRNILGLKPFGIFFSLLPLIVFSILFLLNYPDLSKLDSAHLITFLKGVRVAYWNVTALSLVTLILWIFAVNKATLKDKADKYADTLFKQIDAL